MDFDSDSDIGVAVAVALVNELTPGHVRGRPMPDPIDGNGGAARALAADPSSTPTPSDLPELEVLALRLRGVFVSLSADGLDEAAERLNALLAEYPASPVLSKEDKGWRLHQHPLDAGIVPQWAAICATDLARLVGAGHHHRLGVCGAEGCDRVFADTSKNGSRRFCSTSCQNRIKAATFRRRQASARS